jgi:hypothetical protein
MVDPLKLKLIYLGTRKSDTSVTTYRYTFITFYNHFGGSVYRNNISDCLFFYYFLFCYVPTTGHPQVETRSGYVTEKKIKK